MKSAYELAMERLEKHSPSAKLNAAQKSKIAEIDSLAKAKVAEKELFLKEQVSKAQAAGDHSSVLQIEEQLAREIRRIHSDAEDKKNAVRQE